MLNSIAGEQISITSNGKILATIAPPLNYCELAKKQVNVLSVKAKVHDVTSPTNTEWGAQL
jgi:molybdenum cofactor biosynthesis enzyme MoaA